MGFNTPAEVVAALTKNGINKVRYPLMKTLLLGMMAGLMISFGADAAMIASHGMENMSVARIVSGAIFPVGLISIVLTGSELLTGSCLNVLGIPTGEIRLAGVAKNLVLVAIANAIGAVLLALTVVYIGQLDLSSGRLGAFAIKTAVGKANLGFGPALVSGIWCNFLVCLAVFLGAAAKDVAGKILGIFFPIWVFVSCGFEHSVANMFYLPLGALAAQSPAYAEAAQDLLGISAAQLATLDWQHLLVQNLLPVTIGNVIGGSIFLAGTYYLALKVYTK
ncbi:MAG: formate/nitrite transporter family protein [Peptococcaceae bacterium]|nr:formate/nitrite transporter family protein [Peptococcaceae bacterium]